MDESDTPKSVPLVQMAMVEDTLPEVIPFFRGDPPPPRLNARFELVDVEPLPDPFTEELVARAQARARAAPEVRKLLTGKRAIALGVSRLPGPKDGKLTDAPILVLFYSYTDSLAIEVTLDRSAGRVREVKTARYQPTPIPEEVERAIELARRDARLEPYLREGMRGTVMPQNAADPRDGLADHRLLDVMFLYPDERMPRYKALVDLDTERVLRVIGVDDARSEPPSS